MSRTLIVPLDGTEPAEAALSYAEALARKCGGTLYLVRAAPPDDQATAGRYLNRVAADLQARDLRAEMLVLSGPPANVIVAALARCEADLVVMATHGRTGLERTVQGSVADQVLHRTPVPLLLVRLGHVAPAGWPQRVLVPLDGSTLAAEALGPITAFTEALGAELVLTQIVEFPVPMLTDGAVYMPVCDHKACHHEVELAAARKYLDDVAAGLRTAGRRVTTRALAGPPSMVGQAARVVAEFAKQEGVDAIAMATHGRGGLARLVMGSVATGVLQRATVPLLLVSPAAVARWATHISAAETAGV